MFYDGLTAEEAIVARQAVQTALETQGSDQSYRWSHGNDSSGAVTPIRTFRIKTGHYCREYSETITKGPQPASTVRTACRSSEGRWRVVQR